MPLLAGVTGRWHLPRAVGRGGGFVGSIPGFVRPRLTAAAPSS